MRNCAVQYAQHPRSQDLLLTRRTETDSTRQHLHAYRTTRVMLWQMGTLAQQKRRDREITMLYEAQRETVTRTPLRLSLRARYFRRDRERQHFARRVPSGFVVFGRIRHFPMLPGRAT